MIEQIEFKRRDTLGGGFGIEVTKGSIVIGHIGKRPDTGAFRYWRGQTAALGAPLNEDRDLEALKRKIRSNP